MSWSCWGITILPRRGSPRTSGAKVTAYGGGLARLYRRWPVARRTRSPDKADTLRRAGTLRFEWKLNPKPNNTRTPTMDQFDLYVLNYIEDIMAEPITAQPSEQPDFIEDDGSFDPDAAERYYN
jgi:hypothetical protein